MIIDRDTAARLGVAPQDIDNVLYDAFGQRQVSTMYEPLNQYHVVMEVAPQFQQTTDALQNIYVRSSNGTPVPAVCLCALRSLQYASWRSAIRANVPSVTISFNLAPGMSLGQATQAIEKAEQQH